MPQNKTYHHYLTHNHNKNTFNFQNINEENTESIIDKFAPKSSFGFDGISTRLIKTIKMSLIRPITLINQMLNTGIFPDKLKVTKTMTIHKKDDESLFTNYRPKSLLPAISKIFGKNHF